MIRVLTKVLSARHSFPFVVVDRSANSSGWTFGAAPYEARLLLSKRLRVMSDPAGEVVALKDSLVRLVNDQIADSLGGVRVVYSM